MAHGGDLPKINSKLQVIEKEMTKLSSFHYLPGVHRASNTYKILHGNYVKMLQLEKNNKKKLSRPSVGATKHRCSEIKMFSFFSFCLCAACLK